jgi:RimJ/RimL family protein N-acetyltransferase
VGLIDYANDATNYVEYITLPSRKRLRIRALRRSEEGPIRDLYANLSPRSRRFRFFSSMPALPDSLVRSMATVDYYRTLALVAEDDDGQQRGEIVALASFGAIDDRDVEVALVVRDDWQGQHVGTELATRVMEAAESRGFRRFIAHILPENIAIRRLLKNVGAIVSTKVSGGVSEIAFVRART